jgi:hypothetical protein
MPPQFDIFVSYSSDDARLIDGLVRLMGLTGRRVFVDKNSIKPGTEWETALREAVSNSEQMVLLWCCHSRESKWVAAEIQQAVGDRKSIVPLLLCAEPVPQPVAKYQWIDLRNVVAHPCGHTEVEAGLATVEPRYIMPRDPLVRGLTYWDTLYSPVEYLYKSLSQNSAASTAAQSMAREERIFCAAVMRALEIRWAEDVRLDSPY